MLSWTQAAGQILGCPDPCDRCGIDAYVHRLATTQKYIRYRRQTYGRKTVALSAIYGRLKMTRNPIIPMEKF